MKLLWDIRGLRWTFTFRYWELNVKQNLGKSRQKSPVISKAPWTALCSNLVFFQPVTFAQQHSCCVALLLTGWRDCCWWLTNSAKFWIKCFSVFFGTAKILGIETDRFANSEGPDQTAPLRSSLIRAYTVCYSVCSFWKHFCIVTTKRFQFTDNYGNML